jgi:hypothetical protein
VWKEKEMKCVTRFYKQAVATYFKALSASVIYWSEFLATDPDVRVLFPALPDFLRSSGSGTGSTQPREYN